MDFFGNTSDPLAKTLQQLKENEKDSRLGNNGDFFTRTHERDPHVKPPSNSKNLPVEYNSAIMHLDDSSTMLKYIQLKNKIVEGECIALGEHISIDKEDGGHSVLIQWLQPKGMFELGTANKIMKPQEAKEQAPDIIQEHESGTDVVNDTQPTKNKKGKGSRKRNTRVKL